MPDNNQDSSIKLSLVEKVQPAEPRSGKSLNMNQAVDGIFLSPPPSHGVATCKIRRQLSTNLKFISTHQFCIME